MNVSKDALIRAMMASGGWILKDTGKVYLKVSVDSDIEQRAVSIDSSINSSDAIVAPNESDYVVIPFIDEVSIEHLFMIQNTEFYRNIFSQYGLLEFKDRKYTWYVDWRGDSCMGHEKIVFWNLFTLMLEENPVIETHFDTFYKDKIEQIVVHWCCENGMHLD